MDGQGVSGFHQILGLAAEQSRHPGPTQTCPHHTGQQRSEPQTQEQKSCVNFNFEASGNFPPRFLKLARFARPGDGIGLGLQQSARISLAASGCQHHSRIFYRAHFPGYGINIGKGTLFGGFGGQLDGFFDQGLTWFAQRNKALTILGPPHVGEVIGGLANALVNPSCLTPCPLKLGQSLRLVR